MSEDKTVDQENIEKVDIHTPEGFAQAHGECKDFLANTLMTHPETGEPMIIVVPPQLQPDGSLTFVAADKADPKEGVAFMIMTMAVDLAKDIEVVENELVDSNGNPLTSDTAGGLVGPDGQPLS